MCEIEKWSLAIAVISMLIGGGGLVGIIMVFFKSGKWLGSAEQIQKNAEERNERLKHSIDVKFSEIQEQMKSVLLNITNHIPIQIHEVYDQIAAMEQDIDKKLSGIHGRIDAVVDKKNACQISVDHRLTILETNYGRGGGGK
jgi:hypothetical protein